MKTQQGMILCVDDEIMVLDALKDMLTYEYGQRFAIETTESAEEALEVIDDLEKDNCSLLVIVSDWLMPGMKGDEFLIEVHKRFPKVIKILLSGQADEEAIQRTREQADLHEFIMKPWSSKVLFDSINSGLEKLLIN
jgi:response regulator RpfG family c-di-GMP phosphodiesterase